MNAPTLNELYEDLERLEGIRLRQVQANRPIAAIDREIKRIENRICKLLGEGEA